MAGRVVATFSSSFLVSLTCALLLLSLTPAGGSVKLVQAQEQKTWCVAKPSSDKATLIANLDYACSQVDCSVLQRKGACFDPDILISHASIAMNLYYRAMGRNRWNCYFDNSALVVTTDPSFGSCVYG
nr:PREDICTED: major pollen allergen Ole e 10-like [Musa acuminata subsp. malaccensis]